MDASESAQAVAFVLLVVFLAYVVLIVVPFLRRTPAPEGNPRAFEWHVFIPCRDEETVIEYTIGLLRADFPTAHVWVVDDDSEDRTAELVEARMHDDAKVHLVRRRRPNARTGKGDALNAAYAALLDWLPEGTPHERVVVAVVDADGSLASNALAQAAGPEAFGNPLVGAAQMAVWMSNRDEEDPGHQSGRLARWWARGLVRMQDIEFRSTIAAMQCLRGHTLSVGLGGNGQLTRLSVLDTIAGTAHTPWHGSLLEDYELGIHVMLAGYRNVYLHDTHVEQEALPSARRMLTQRTRWCQGGMQCLKYLPQIFGSPYVTNAGAVEAGYFLLMPCLQLIGTVLWPLVFVLMVAQGSLTMGGVVAWAAASWWLLPLVALTGVLPFAIWPLIYGRRDEPRGLGTAFGWALGYWLYSYQNYVCVLRAFGRSVSGRTGWAKTRRNAEVGALLLAREA